nr:hypothetical protein [uncultured Draconibacterium sp.]
MINIQKIGKLVLLAFIVTGFWACNDDDPEPFGFTAEVVTLKRSIGGEEKFALAYYAYGNMKIDSASVKISGDSTLVLPSTGTLKITRYYNPSMEDFTTTAPVTKNYDFSVKNNNVEYTETENHTFTDLDIPTIDSVGVTTNNKSVYVKWDKVDDAEGYFVQIFDNEHKAVFNTGGLISKDSNSITANESTGRWGASLSAGKTYTVEVQAMLFEDGATNANSGEQIETIAIASEDFTFGD